MAVLIFKILMFKKRRISTKTFVDRRFKKIDDDFRRRLISNLIVLTTLKLIMIIEIYVRGNLIKKYTKIFRHYVKMHLNINKRKIGKFCVLAH